MEEVHGLFNVYCVSLTGLALLDVDSIMEHKTINLLPLTHEAYGEAEATLREERTNLEESNFTSPSCHTLLKPFEKQTQHKQRDAGHPNLARRTF